MEWPPGAQKCRAVLYSLPSLDLLPSSLCCWLFLNLLPNGLLANKLHHHHHHHRANNLLFCQRPSSRLLFATMRLLFSFLPTAFFNGFFVVFLLLRAYQRSSPSYQRSSLSCQRSSRSYQRPSSCQRLSSSSSSSQIEFVCLTWV